MDPLSHLSEKALDFALKLLGQELGYLLCYKNREKELNEKAEQLRSEQRAVLQRVEEARRNGQDILENVEFWLKNAGEKQAEIQTDGDSTKTKWSNYEGLIPDLFVRHQLGRRAAKLAVDVDDILKNSKFDPVSCRHLPTCEESVFSDIGYEILDSRNKTVEEIINALKDSRIKIIGMWGPGGVGKTTILKAVARRVQEMKLFKVVVMATVTRNPQIKKVQGEIAAMLGMTLDEETEIGRAGELWDRLKKDKENTLVILDDLWDGLDLNKLGIPVHDDDSNWKITKNERVLPSSTSEKEKSGDHFGACKILLTSRSKEVLSLQMDVTENSIFYVGFLEEKEAEILFKKVTELHDKNSDFDLLASKIAKKCARLPVALVTIGRALKHKSSIVWNDALRQLERQEFSGVQQSMELSTKLSYDHLESEELKATFLLCAQMGNDFLLVDLLKYSIGLGILEGVYTIREARDKLNVLIGRLKDSSLLLGNYSGDHLKMHDVIRDAALSVAFKDQHALIKRYIKLDDWLDEDKLKEYITISLRYCDIIDGLPQNINCPRLKVFHMENNDHSLRIPDKFFEGMTQLRVLVLIGIDISCMPSSIKCLKNLRMLCLEQCVIGDGLSLIGGLKKLRVLSLAGSSLKYFPTELGHSLQLLDISNCSMHGVIPPNVISCLNNLEELYMRNNLVQWELEGKKNASLLELGHLHQLKALDIHIPNLDAFPKNLFFQMLDYYMITIGDFRMFLMEGFKMPDQYEASRTLALHLNEGNNIYSEKGIKLLYKTVENLFLGKLNGVENIFYELNLQGFPCLKHLYIANNFDIKYIFNSMNLLLPQDVFPNIESLHLYKLENLKTICSSHLPGASFCKLKIVKIKMCHQLQSLFTLSMVRLLTNLETIEVSECNSLKEIVDIRRQDNAEIAVEDYEVEKIELPKLRHVTLQGLFQLIGFYTDGLSIFGKRVEIPKLESLELSSMKISHIWGDIHLSPTSNFQSLIKLDVKNCDNLKYLLSISMAKFLDHLRNLHVSNCEGMEELITQEDRTNITEVHIFHNLKEIKLSNMRNLMEIWHKASNNVGLDSYCNLESVVIEKCKKLVTVFPPHMAGMLKSLDSVVVGHCELVEVIFDFRNIPLTDGEKYTCLRKVDVSSLNNLKHVWNRHPEGILNLKKLQDVEVSDCHNIKSLFSLSMARGLRKLESLEIDFCYGVKQIVGSREGSDAGGVTFEFPQLTSLTFWALPELRCFYPGKHDIKWPQLKNLRCYDCDRLMTFTAETTNPERLPILSEQVILYLQSLTLGSNEADLLSYYINNCHLDGLKTLELIELRSSEFLFGLLLRTPNLEQLSLCDCKFQNLLLPGRLAALEKIGTVVQLKNLTLSCMTSLYNIGFEHDPALFQLLQRLTIVSCYRLVILVPGSICFNHLTYLKVSHCDELINLIESSTAMSLSQLTTLEVMDCRVMEEIVANKGSGDERENKIVFRRLTTLKLDSLTNLSSFCNSKDCLFMFPLLESLVVRKCPKMKIFCQGVITAPKLRKVYFAEGEEEGKWYWNDDLNSTIQKISTDVTGFEYIDDLKLYDHPQLEKFWHVKVSLPENCFKNLKSLVVENCEFLSTVIPCYLIPYLKNLKELEVRSCSLVEKIFDISGIKTGEVIFHLEKLEVEKLPNLKNIFFEHSEYLKVSDGPQLEKCFCNLKELVVERCDFLSVIIPCNLVPYLKNLESLQVWDCNSVEKIFDNNDGMMTFESKELAFHLKSLVLINLPALKNVWNLVKNPRGLFSFPNLGYVWISCCSSLNYLFPASMAKNLQSLFMLIIQNCEEMETIVGKDQVAAEGAISKFRFPCLSRLHLHGLFKLKCFFPSKHNLEFPILDFFNVFHCGQLEIFTQYFQSYKVASVEGDICRSINIQALFSLQEVIPKQENLTLNPKETKMLFCGEHQVSLHKIKRVTLQCFHNVYEEDTLPHGFFNNFPNIEGLRVFCSGFKVLFPSQMPEVDNTRILAQLRGLTIKLLPWLKSIGFELSWLEPLRYNLKILKVKRCNCLTALVHSAVSFCNLKELTISSCHGLEYLFSSSTAKSLVQLKEMSIKSSKSIKEIVAKEEDDSSLDEITFGNLQNLTLLSLSSLLSFYAGNSTLNFPTLVTLSISECPNMKIFSQGIINAPMLEATGVSHLISDGFHWDSDLNAAIVKLFHEKRQKKCGMAKYHCQKPVFDKLQTLVIENCDFLLNVIPSHLITYLKNLKKLQVKNCIQVEAIFDINDMKIATNKEVSFLLEILTLDQLPNLKHIWSKDTEGIVAFGNLQEVQFTKCKYLEAPFTIALFKNLGKLEKLTIESCEAMEKIVGNDEASIESSTAEFVFPWLTSMVLSENPKLKFFYTGRHNLIFTNLKYLRIYHCGKLKMFALNSHSFQEGKAEDLQGVVSVDARPLFSIQKVLPKLVEVSLNVKEAMMLWHKESKEPLLNNIKCLQLYCLHNVNEADTLPFGFLLKVPNLETLAITCSGFKEMFPSQRLEDHLIRKLAQLKGLKLVNLSELSSVGLEHSWLDQLCENLEVLQIWRCPRLTNIVQSTVSFSNIKELLINQCHGLKFLFTSSTAKSLMRLKEMFIEECGSIKRIVAKEEDESTEDEIIFEQLMKISLNSLPSLTSFYTGNFSLKLPSLHRVIITQCPNMNIFSHRSISAPELMGIQVSQDEYVKYDRFGVNVKHVESDMHWDGDLNSTIKQLFHAKDNVVN